MNYDLRKYGIKKKEKKNKKYSKDKVPLSSYTEELD